MATGFDQSGVGFNQSGIPMDGSTGTSYSDSVSIVGAASVSLALTLDQTDSITATGAGTTTSACTLDQIASISLPGMASADVSSGSAQSDSITIAGVANFLPSIATEVWVEGFTGKLGSELSKLGYIEFGIIPRPPSAPGGPTGYDKSLSVIGTATILLSDNMAELLIAGAATVAATSVYAFSDSVSLVGAASATLVAGYVLENTINPVASAFLDPLPGFTYDVSATVTGAAAFAELDILALGNVADTVGAASVSFTTVVDPGNFSAADAGTATLAVANDLVAEAVLGISAAAAFYPENIFDIIPSQAVAAASVALAYDFATAPVLNVQGQASASVQVVGSISVSVSQTLTLSQVLGVTRPVVNVSQTLGLVQQVSKVKIASPSVVQTFVLTQQAFRIYPIVQTLSLVQVVAPTRVHRVSVVQTLALSQVAATSFVKPVQVVQTLPLLQVRTTFTQLGVTIQIPGAGVSVVRQKCHFVMQVPARAIVLPCPVFGDGEGNNGQVLIKRTVNGDRYSYVKKSETRRLNYSFSMGTAKRYELLDFLYNYSDQLVTINNHKGEVWRGYITTNPFAATSVGRWEKDRENFNVTLEFEGLRVS